MDIPIIIAYFTILFIFVNVLLPFYLTECLYYDEPLKRDDINIIKKGPMYNLGDLLNMPLFYCDYKTPHTIYKDTLEFYKDNTIFGIYDSITQDAYNEFPNISNIRKSVDIYIENNKQNKYFMDLLEYVNNPRILCVHMRSGDFGLVNKEFLEIIYKLQKEYDKVIIMTGIHYDRQDAYENILTSINSVFNNEHKNILISIEDPDFHMAMYRKCINLLVHRRGFSMLASFVFQGHKLYVCKEIFNFYTNSITEGKWKDYMQPDTKVFKELVFIR